MLGMDLPKFSAACGELYSPGLDLETFPSRGFAFLRRLVSSEFIACGTLNSRERCLTIGFDAPHSDFPAAMTAFGALMSRYPLFNFDPGVCDGRPFCRSQFFSRRQFADLDIFQEVFRPFGIDNHCAVHVPIPPGETMFFGLERSGGSDFSSHDLIRLQLAQDHLANANALARTFTHADDTVEPALLTHAGLTPREAEVLSWLNKGKSNHEIGLLLGIGLHTVKAHITSIFNKTGTSNRLAVVLWAREICRDLNEASTLPAGFVAVAA